MTPATQWDRLHHEFNEWIASRGLNDESGDAHGYLMRDDLLTSERQWLHAFIARWDRAQDAADNIRAILETADSRGLENERTAALRRDLLESGF